MDTEAVEVFPPFAAAYATLLTDYLKHITTLSTGAILLQIAFLEKIFQHPKWKAFVVMSLLFFTVSVVSASTAMEAVMNLTAPNPLPLNVGRWAAKRALSRMTLSWRMFVCGLVAVILFAVRNLLAIT